MSGNTTSIGFGPDDQEQNIARFRKHGRALSLPVLLLLVLAPAAGYCLAFYRELWQTILIAVLAFLVLVFGVLMPLFSWLTTRTTITTKRVIVRHGVFTKHRVSVPFTRIKTVATKASLFQQMARCGRVELDVAEAEPLILQSVPGVELVAETLQQLIERSYRAHTRAQGFFTQGE